MKEIIKEFKLKRFTYILLSLFFLESSFAIFMDSVIDLESIINIFLWNIIFTSFLSIILGLFKEKGSIILTSIVLFTLGILFSLQLVFFNTFQSFFSFSILGLSDQLTSFMSETFTAIKDNIFYILLFLLPMIIFLIFHKKFAFTRSNKNTFLLYLIIFFISLGLYVCHIFITKNDNNGSYYLYHDVNSISLNLSKFGVTNSYLIDIYRSIFGFDDTLIPVTDENFVEEKEEEIIYNDNILDISFDKKTSNNDIKSINKYMENTQGTKKNEYSGKYQGYNLIYIVAESFSEIGVREDLTPTLYKLTHSGLIFDKYYTPNTLSTIGGEFQALTGLYPDSSILNKWRKGNNYFPYGLGTVFKNLGYKTYAYHNNWYGFQDRHKYLKSQGFTNYIGCYNGMEKRMNCKNWPQSDLDMVKVTMKDYINNEEPFLAYYMTVSGHFQYNFSDNSMAHKHKKEVNNLNLSTAAKAYLATQIELDKALEYMIKTLEENNKLDNTVIVLLADHYPYKLDLKSINSLSTYQRDSLIEVNHNNLILWNSKQEDKHIDKPCMSSDVIPTVYNLFGVEFDSRLFTGRDILSPADGLVIFNNRSWITDKGVYHANKKKFVGEEDNEYVNNINNLVKNRLSVAKLIIKNDYYKYLLK